MKIVLVTFSEPHFIPLLFKPVMEAKPELISELVIVPFYVSKKNLLVLTYTQLQLLGIIGFIKKSVETIRLSLRSENNLKQIAKNKQIPVTNTSSINSKYLKKRLLRIKPDLIIAQVPEKVSSQILDIPKIGVINKHASLLPSYRGLYPLFWALLKPEKEIGYTLHLMDKSIDKGTIIVQKKVKYTKSDTVETLYRDIFKSAGNDLLKIITAYEKGIRVKGKKIKGHGSYFSTPAKSDIKYFKKLGLKYY